MAACGCSLVPPGSRDATSPAKEFSFSTFDAVNVRKNSTTQVAIRVKEWPGQTFLLWFPEAVGDLWVQWDEDAAHQEFSRTPAGGIRWEFRGNPEARITAELIPRAQSLLAEVRVTNVGERALHNVRAQNCFHLSAAPDFACDDFTRVYVRVDGRWQSLAELEPSVGLPMYYRPGYPESDRTDSWEGHFRKNIQTVRAESPLIICTSKDGQRAVATASGDWECVFHNRELPYLLCIHSQQAPQPSLAPGEEVLFRQVIYFIDGGVEECVGSWNGMVSRASEEVSRHASRDCESGAVAPSWTRREHSTFHAERFCSGHGFLSRRRYSMRDRREQRRDGGWEVPHASHRSRRARFFRRTESPAHSGEVSAADQEAVRSRGRGST
jgi:hypothetical protein